MKIGIITLEAAEDRLLNLGNYLQNYAVQVVLKRLGYECETIRLFREVDQSAKARGKRCLKRILKQKYPQGARALLYQQFMDKYLRVTEGRLENLDQEKYQYFLCGSDQIWNPAWAGFGYHYADFAPKEKRIAYAASFGASEIPESRKEEFRYRLNEMQAISVREQSGAQIVKDLTGKTVDVLVDPTLMLSREEWRRVEKKPSYYRGQRFVLSYFLGEMSEEARAFADALCSKYGYEHISLERECGDDLWYLTGPSEFIWLLDHCEFVCTDSFHGSVFSTLMDKPFQIFVRKGGASMDSRVQTLVETLKLERHRYRGQALEEALEKNYEHIPVILQRERERAEKYLRSVLCVKTEKGRQCSGKPGDMKEWECCGCHACVAICPVQCITMQEDEEGFLYPCIDEGSCIGCGKCERVCSGVVVNHKRNAPQAYACWNNQEKIRMQSSSGGMFTLLAEWIISQGGAVFGAAFDADYRVRHICVEKVEELSALRGSKYLQSIIGDTFKQAKDLLDRDRYVLFSGTPCQIDALKQFLGKDYEHLYTQDIICHGVPSPKAWAAYLKYREKIIGSPIVKDKPPIFRQKETGWLQYEIQLDFENGECYRSVFSKDPYMLAFLKDICLRPSCYACQSKGLQRNSDFTLADYWGVQIVQPEMFDNKGTSLVLVHTQKGARLLEEISGKSCCKLADLEKAAAYNPSLINLPRYPSEELRRRFFAEMEKQDFEELMSGILEDVSKA